MSTTTEAVGIENLTEMALRLPVEERTILLHRLRDSLLTKRERETQDAWLDVAKRRLDEVRSGKVEAIDAEIVFAEARKALEE